jgi:hypothetical protein
MGIMTIIKAIFMEHVIISVKETNHYAETFHNSMEASITTDTKLLSYREENTVGLF